MTLTATQRIHYWRDQVASAENTLEAVYKAVINPNSHITYRHGNNEIVVVVIETFWRANRCRVQNLKTGNQYLLDYSKIDRVLS